MKKIYLLLLCLPFLGFAQSHTVTFQVNTQNITVGPNGIYAGGGVLGGSNAVALSDPDATAYGKVLPRYLVLVVDTLFS